ncbi:hypothetical protein EDB85DRAFT_1892267 [Lactarius pseudohatsudake]|nr:hypothetical protein EDB85DRAFT_1892267 [Lactarius pseudohatsudake]
MSSPPAVFAVNPLGLGDTAYAGPSREEVRDAGSCWCNTVAFSLISACSECQGGQSLLWSEYYQNCARILEPSTFPNPVPAGTRVPQWALVDITLANDWSPSTAQLVGGKQLSLFSLRISFPTVPEPSLTSSGSGLNKGASAGGVIRGVIAIATRRILKLSGCSGSTAQITPPSNTFSTTAHAFPVYDKRGNSWLSPIALLHEFFEEAWIAYILSQFLQQHAKLAFKPFGPKVPFDPEYGLNDQYSISHQRLLLRQPNPWLFYS